MCVCVCVCVCVCIAFHLEGIRSCPLSIYLTRRVRAEGQAGEQITGLCVSLFSFFKDQQISVLSLCLSLCLSLVSISVAISLTHPRVHASTHTCVCVVMYSCVCVRVRVWHACVYVYVYGMCVCTCTHMTYMCVPVRILHGHIRHVHRCVSPL